MGTNIRPELSTINKYWIPKHRYYELKHFCLQYQDFKNQLEELYSDGGYQAFIRVQRNKNMKSDPTFNLVALREELKIKIDLIESTAKLADAELYDYILKAVTEEAPLHYLVNVMGMPASKNCFYDRYHKFFWLLDKKMGIQVTDS